MKYGIAFHIVRPLFDRTETTMLISGALGVFKRDLVIELGGYALNTVGEDMELVMRIRRYSAVNHSSLKIGYTSMAVCYTELPWKISDIIEQRIRWTVGLSDVLWKYRDIAIQKKYCIKERIAFWCYVIFEKYSPHIEFISMIVYFCCKMTLNGLIQMVFVALLQLVLSVIGSLSSIKHSIESSDSKFKAVVKIGFLLIFFVTIYHYAHSFVRLFAVPYHRITRRKSKNKNTSWNSPTRM